KGVPRRHPRGSLAILASMRHRVRALGGTFDVTPSATGGMLDVRIPTARALRQVPQPESPSVTQEPSSMRLIPKRLFPKRLRLGAAGALAAVLLATPACGANPDALREIVEEQCL